MGPLKKCNQRLLESIFQKKKRKETPFDRTYSVRLTREKANMKRSGGLLAFSLPQVRNLSAKTEMLHRA